MTRGVKIDRFKGIIRSIFNPPPTTDMQKKFNLLEWLKTMKTLALIRLFIENWLRKLISFILAVIIWMVVDPFDDDDQNRFQYPCPGHQYPRKRLSKACRSTES